MKENYFQNQVKKWLELQGAYVVKYVAGSIYGTSGVPDLIVCYNGNYIAFELKVGNNKASDLQKAHLEKIRNAQGLAYVFRHSADWKDRLFNIINQVDEVVDDLWDDYCEWLSEDIGVGGDTDTLKDNDSLHNRIEWYKNKYEDKYERR